MLKETPERLPVDAIESGVPVRPPSGQPDMLSRHLERSLQALLAEMRDEEGQPSLESVRAFLGAAVAQALAAQSGVLETLSELRGGRLEEAPRAAREGAEAIADAAAVQTALLALQRLQRSFLSSVLSYLSVTGNTSLEIESMFEALNAAEDALIERWFSGESLRRTELLAQVMHDFRSPLTSVFFLADALYAGLSGELSEAQKHQVGLVFSGALSLLTLVDNVLSSRNLETGKFKLEKVPFSVHALCEEVERIARPLADQASLALKFELSCRGARVGDQEVLRRILLNLVNNAINYTDEGYVVVRFDDRERDLLLQVEDTGPGIDAEKLVDLFRTFRRSTAQRHGERRFSGSGLGLSICHRLTQLAGGDIWVESEVGRGSTFYARLPFTPLEESR